MSRVVSTDWHGGAFRKSFPRRRERYLNNFERYFYMNKLLAALIVAAFATTGAFAQAPAKKDEAKPAAAAAAPAAKKEEAAKPAAAAPAASAAKKADAKPAAKKEEAKK